MIIRVRLKFDSTPVSYAQKCWFVFDDESCRLVSDVSHLIASHFGLQNRHGIQLYMDEYLVPTNESAKVFRDNDTIQVKTVPTALASSSSSSDDDEEEEEESLTAKRRRLLPKKPPDKSSGSGKVKSSTSQLPAPPPPVKKLLGVTKKLPSGGLHTKFRSSSSSSSSSSSEEESSDSSPHQPAVARGNKAPPSQWDVKKPTVLSKTAVSAVKPGVVMKTTAAVHPKRVAPVQVARGGMDSLVGKSARTRRRRSRKGKGSNIAPAGAIVGGPSDILTTKSLMFTSPVGAVSNVKVTDVAVRSKKAPAGVTGGTSPVIGERSVEGIRGNGREEERRGAEGAEEDPTGTRAGTSGHSALSASVGELECEPLMKDYSGCAALQGMPRVGDSLAFKTLELSSSYTPEVSDFMEASVVSVDYSAQSVRLKYSDDTLLRLSKKAENQALGGKFSVEDKEGDTEGTPTPELKEEIDLAISDLLEAVLIT